MLKLQPGFLITRAQGTAVSLLVLASTQAFGLEPLADTVMSDVVGQDGLTVTFQTDTDVTADALKAEFDAGTVNVANITAQDLRLSGVDLVGNTGGGFNITTEIDVATNAADLPGMRIGITSSRFRIESGALRLNREAVPAATTPDPYSFGRVAIDGSVSLEYANFGGLFNASGSDADLSASFTDGRIFYRQLWHEHPYLIFDNVQAAWNISGGTVGFLASAADDPFGMSGGLIQSADRIDLQLEADWEYKFPVGLGEQPFTITGNELPMLRFGWNGAVKDADLVWRTGGAWANDAWASATQGLTFSSRWNYITNAEALAAGDAGSEFRWVLGESGGGVQLELSDWRPLGNNPYAHNFPLISLDVINAGQGPGGLCFGGANAGPLSAGAGCANGQVLNLQAGDINAFRPETYSSGGVAGGGTRVTNAPALAAFVRDGNLLAVSNKVKLREAGVTTWELNWGLIYTLANIDGNIYVYPGGNPSDDILFGGGGNSLDYGVIFDLLLMSQTLSSSGDVQGLNWNQGSHFMLADTEFETGGVGIGFLGANVLLAANDARFWIKPQWNSADFYEGGIDILAPQSRLGFSGFFGGATLPDGLEIVQGAFIDINFEGLLNLRLSPSDPASTLAEGGSNYLGYSMAARFGNLDDANFALGSGGNLASGSGSYIALAEPGRTDVEIRLDQITGDVALVNGIVDLRGEGEESAGSRPSLVISHDILIGQTAAARMNDAVVGHSLPGGAAGQPLIINDVSFSGDSLGKIAVPSGQWGAKLALKPQLP